jgi:dTDP-4-dehydrorhamnose 3,5-epimerase
VIDGVKIVALKPHVDDRGYVVEILRASDEHFKGFGQVYLTTCHPGIVKAWHMHEKQTDSFFVVKGHAKIGLYDDREESPTRGEKMSVVIGEQNPALVQIPPRVWHGQMAVGPETSYLINIPTEVYNAKEPDELRRDPFDPEIGFEWLPKSR